MYKAIYIYTVFTYLQYLHIYMAGWICPPHIDGAPGLGALLHSHTDYEATIDAIVRMQHIPIMT